MKTSVLLGGMAALLFAAGAAVADEPVGKVQIVINGQPVELTEHAAKLAPETAKLGKYWLGLMVAPLGDEQRKEMKVPEGQGLVVKEVVPDGPAAKAKLQENDVLLKAGDKPLGSVDDLLAAVNAAQDKPLAIRLLREGKEQTIQVAPAKRPSADLQKLEELLGRFDEMVEGEGKEGPRVFRFHTFGPGAILPPGAALPPNVTIQRPLPENMTITINKTGSKPTHIVVKQGEEKWEGTEDQVDKMPAKFRPYVDQMLGRLPMGLGAWNVRVLPQAGGAGPNVLYQRVAPAPLDKRIEERFEQMNQRIDKLFKMLEEGRQGAPRSQKSPPKHAEKKPVEM